MAKTSVEFHMEGFGSDRVRCEGGGLLMRKGQAGGAANADWLGEGTLGPLAHAAGLVTNHTT